MGSLLVLTSAALVTSFLVDRKRTFQGLRKALKMFLSILPSLLTVLILIAIVLYIVPPERIRTLLSTTAKGPAMIIAAGIGSIALIPGFIAYPLCGVLLKSGVGFDVIAVFITTLMMVGVLTLPLEARYFGMRTAVLRNSLSFVGALVVGLLMAVVL